MIVFNSLKAKINVSLILFDGFDFKMRKKKERKFKVEKADWTSFCFVTTFLMKSETKRESSQTKFKGI